MPIDPAHYIRWHYGRENALAPMNPFAFNQPSNRRWMDAGYGYYARRFVEPGRPSILMEPWSQISPPYRPARR